MKQQKIPKGIGEGLGVITTFKGRDREYVVFKKDRFVQSPPPEGQLIEACHEFVVWGVRGQLQRIFMVRSYAQKKLTQILRKRYDGIQP